MSETGCGLLLCSPALLLFAMLSCHLPSPNLYVLYPVTFFETALLHALTVTLIVHRGKARYSRFEDLSDISLSRNPCRRVYLTESPPNLETWALPNLFFIINTRVIEVSLSKWSLGSSHCDV